MRQIFVLERADRQPFDFPTTPVKVLGIGFATEKEASAIMTLMPNSKDFIIHALIEGLMPPIFDPTNPPDPKQTN